MHTPTTSTHPTTQLDLVRGDAAARQRRAATYRFVHDPRPTTGRSRRSLIGVAVAAALTLGIVGCSPTAATDTPIPSAQEAGHADGRFSPDGDDATLSTAEDSIRPAATPLRQGYEAGRPDGWYLAGTPGVQVAGTTVARTSSATVPANVR